MMNLKERLNSWEWNIPVSELRNGCVYVADGEDDELVMMAELEFPDGSIRDIQIIGVSDDMETITVSTATRFAWGKTVCFPYAGIRSAYLHYVTGKVA